MDTRKPKRLDKTQVKTLLSKREAERRDMEFQDLATHLSITFGHLQSAFERLIETQRAQDKKLLEIEQRIEN